MNNGTEEATRGLLASPADAARHLARIGSARNRPQNNGCSYLVSSPSASQFDQRVGTAADAGAAATNPPTGLTLVEMGAARTGLLECLSSIGLPGEEAATFEPLIIEPYEPAPSTAVTITCTADPPSGPMTPPSASSPAEPAAQPSSAVAAIPAAFCASAGTAIQPRPPPGSALQRFASSRRSLLRQPSQTYTTAGNGGGAAAAVAAPPLPITPRTPLAAASDAPPIPPSPALSLGEFPIAVFDPTAVSLLASVAAVTGAGLVDSKATTSFLDPTKPAVRRLLPPLLRASQALQDSVSDSSTAGLDDAAAVIGHSPGTGPSTSRGGSSVSSPAGCAGGTAGGAGAGLDSLTELQEALASVMPPPATTEPMPLAAPLLCVDMHDTTSPRVRRALPPMEPQRTHPSGPLSAALALDAVAAAAVGTEPYTATLSDPYVVMSPRRSGSFSARRGLQARHLLYDTDSPGVGRERRPCTTAASDGGDGTSTPGDRHCSRVSGDGDGGSVVAGVHGSLLQRTTSCHAVAGAAVGAGGCGSGGGFTTGQPEAAQRLQARGVLMPTDVALLSLSSGGGSGGGAAHATGRELGRLCRTNTVGAATARMATALAAAPSPLALTAAPLPPILDRGSGGERRQTLAS